jgi:hypothetical protein
MKTWTKGMVTVMLAGAVVLGSLPAWADPWGPRPVGPPMIQPPAVYRGVQSGRITPREFHRLQQQRGHIRMAEARMRADGHLDRRERARLHQMENRYNRNVYRYNHNQWGGPRPY